MLMIPAVNYPFSHKFNASIYVALTFTLLVFFSCKKSPVHQDHPEISDAINDSTSYLLNAGMLQPAKAYLDTAYAKFPHAGPGDLWKKYQIMNNFYTYYVIDPIKGRLYMDSMFFALKNIEKRYPLEHTRNLFALGNSMLAEKKFNEAFQQFYKARAYALKNLDTCKIGHFTNWLGLVKYRQGQYSKAIPYLKQAVLEYQHCKDTANFEAWFIDPQSTLNTTALSFENIAELDSAAKYYNKALLFITSRANSYPEKKDYIEMARGIIYGNLGGVHSKLKNYKKAEAFLKKSIEINSKPGFAIDDAQTARRKLARQYIQTARYPEADSLLDWIRADLIRQHDEHMNVESGRMELYKLRSQYHEALNDSKSALFYMRKYYALNDSLLKVNEGLKSADMEQQFSIAREKNGRALMEKNNDIKSLWIVVLSIFLVIIVAIAIYINYSFKRHRRISARVMEQNILLKAALTSLEQSQADNTRILQIVAHDLRNPIGNIKMLVALMMKMENRPEEDIKWLEMISKSAVNSLDLVSELLLMNTRSEDLIKEQIDLLGMLAYCVEMLNHKAQEKGQQIKLVGTQMTITGSREKLWRVFSNLIANAIKFSPQQSVITVTLSDHKGWASVSVADLGIGIPDDMKEKIFDMFSEAKRPGTAGEQSFGMGLAISKQIVEAHKGKIWFKSTAGAGTVFCVDLPEKVQE